MHIPAVGKSKAASIAVSVGPKRDGLPEAKQRLGYLNSVRTDQIQTLTGEIAFEGASDVCANNKDAIQSIMTLKVGNCRASMYRLTMKSGYIAHLIDIVATTSDNDAAADMHIPFGIIDSAETELFDERGASVSGTVSFIEVPSSSDTTINIIRSFKRGR